MKNISILVPVYNEENRIENFIKSFLWSNDIIIVDKASNDRTVEIAEQYNVKIFNVEYSDNYKVGGDVLIENAQNEWVMFVTVSDVIHPRLVKKLLALINEDTFEYDIIKGPWARYILGIDDKHSPWYQKECGIIAHRQSVTTLSNTIHGEINMNSDRIFVINPKDCSQGESFYHLTHQSVDSSLERTYRYCRNGEIKKFSNESKALKQCGKDIIKAVLKLFIQKRTWKLGWDGLALMCDYMVYFMVKYLYVWEKFKGLPEDKYDEIKMHILDEWEKEKM